MNPHTLNTYSGYGWLQKNKKGNEVQHFPLKNTLKLTDPANLQYILQCLDNPHPQVSPTTICLPQVSPTFVCFEVLL